MELKWFSIKIREFFGIENVLVILELITLWILMSGQNWWNKVKKNYESTLLSINSSFFSSQYSSSSYMIINDSNKN